MKKFEANRLRVLELMWDRTPSTPPGSKWVRRLTRAPTAFPPKRSKRVSSVPVRPSTPSFDLGFSQECDLRLNRRSLNQARLPRISKSSPDYADTRKAISFFRVPQSAAEMRLNDSPKY